MVEKEITSTILLVLSIPWLLVGLVIIVGWLAWGNFEYLVLCKLGQRRFS